MSANRIRNLLIVLVASSTVVGCAGLNDPYDPYYGSGGGGPYGGGGYYGRDPYYGGPGYGGTSYQDRRERERLEEERRRLERERERLERERERQESYRPPPPPPQYRPPAQYDRCPDSLRARTSAPKRSESMDVKTSVCLVAWVA